MAIQVKAVDSKQDFTKLAQDILNAVEQGLDDVAASAEKDFLATVATWDEKPTFDIQKETMLRRVGTNNQTYAYINSGTHVRYATMTPDFQAKTEPQVLSSKMGQGGLAYVSRKRPRPGIKARDFDKTIADKYEKDMADMVQDRINRVP